MKRNIGLYIADKVFEQAPELTGLPLVRHGRQWWGGCRMNGESHPRKDKLKVYIWNGKVWLHEEGGESMPLDVWMMTHGGLTEREVWKILKGDGSYWAPKVHKEASESDGEVRYVDRTVMDAMKKFPLERCPLFRWMAGMFGEDKVREAWERYHVTTDTLGRAVFWYVDRNGRVLYDKRITYKDNGHRDKERHPGRDYRIGDGYTGRCLFGIDSAQWSGSEVYVCESEKSALLGYLYWGRPFVATGGKSNLRMARELGDYKLLCPDMDARGSWDAHGQVWKWWELWGGPVEDIPRTADIGDLVERLKNLA